MWCTRVSTIDDAVPDPIRKPFRKIFNSFDTIFFGWDKLKEEKKKRKKKREKNRYVKISSYGFHKFPSIRYIIIYALRGM